MGFKNKFDAGELDKWTHGSIDDPAYSRGVAWLENFNLLENGGINRRKGYKYICKILEGTDDKAVKLVPISIDDNISYLVYVSKSGYGYLKFSGYDLIDSGFKPAPTAFTVDGEYVFFKTDPDTHYIIKAFSKIAAKSIYDTLPIGAEFDVFFTGCKNVAVGKIASEAPPGDTGVLIEAAVFDLPLLPETYQGTLTQDKEYNEDKSYFSETGTGSGLLLRIRKSEPNDDGDFTYSVMVLNGGKGYDSTLGDGLTQIRINIEGKDVDFVADASGGIITSVHDKTLRGAPPLKKSEVFYYRYFCSAIGSGEYNNAIDFLYRQPDTLPKIIADVSLARKTAFAQFYDISFTINDDGMGTGFIPSVSFNYNRQEDIDIIFLRLMFSSVEDNTLYQRELHCVGRLLRWWEKTYTFTKTWTSENSPFIATTHHTEGTGNNAHTVTEQSKIPVTVTYTLRWRQNDGRFSRNTQSGFLERYSGRVTVSTVYDFTGGSYDLPAQSVDTDVDEASAVMEACAFKIQNRDMALSESEVAFANRLEDKSFSVSGQTLTFLGVTADCNVNAQVDWVTYSIRDKLDSVDEITGWYDDGMALADTNDPFAAGSCFDWKTSNDCYLWSKSRMLGGAGLERFGTPDSVSENTEYASISRHCGLWHKKLFQRKRLLTYYSTSTDFWNNISVDSHYGNVLTHIGAWNIRGGESGPVNFWDNIFNNAPGLSGVNMEIQGYLALNWSCQKGFATNRNTTPFTLWCDSGVPIAEPEENVFEVKPLTVVYGGYFENRLSMIPVVRPAYRGEKFYVNNTPDPGNTGYDYISIALGLPQENDNVIHSHVRSIEGAGAVLSVNYETLMIDDVPKIRFGVKVLERGRGYFKAKVDFEKALRLYIKDLAGDYVYSFVLPAESVGLKDELYLKDADNEGYVYAVVDAVIPGAPPLGKQSAKLSGVNEQNATARVYVEVEFVEGTFVYKAAATIDKNGDVFMSTGDWSVDDIVAYGFKNDAVMVGKAVTITPVRQYYVEIAQDAAGNEQNGKYVKDIKGEMVSVVIDSKTYAVSAEETELREKPILDKLAPKIKGKIYKVTTDETKGGLGAFYEWNDIEWTQKTKLSLPTTDAGINRLQYVYNGEILAFAGDMIPPFYITLFQSLTGDAAINLDGFTVSSRISYDITAPEDFVERVGTKLKPCQPDGAMDAPGWRSDDDGYDINSKTFKTKARKTVPKTDPAVPSQFFADPNDCPSVIYFDSNRWWVGCTLNEPNRIWVSKPVRSKSQSVLDFSTYEYFITVQPIYKPFQAKNNPPNAPGWSNVVLHNNEGYDTWKQYNANVLFDPSDGILTDARKALQYLRTDRGNVTFDTQGVKCRPFIMGTPYFKDGSDILSASDNLFLEKEHKPIENEYTEYHFNLLKLMTEICVQAARSKIVWGVSPCYSISFDCDGFEVRNFAGGVAAPPIMPAGQFNTSIVCVPYTEWGSVVQCAANIVQATIASVGATTPSVLVSSAPLLPISLTAQYLVTQAFMQGFLAVIQLPMTNGRTRFARSVIGDAISGAKDPPFNFVINSRTIISESENLTSRNRLYSTIQPFLLRTWEIKEKEQSTIGCGFTFVMSSEEKEEINFISAIRSFLAGTASSERTLPMTVNGAQQSAQVNSFYGSEKVQPAKSADGIYYLQKGGQRIMRAYYQPNVPVPVISDVQKYNREILRDRKVVSMKSTKSLPVQVWNVIEPKGSEKGIAAVVTDFGGLSAWSRVISGTGDILDTAAIPINGMSAFRHLAIKNEKGIFIIASQDAPSEPNDVFLDSWQYYDNVQKKDMYSDDAVIFDKTTHEVFPIISNVPAGLNKYIGYLYTSKMRTLPVAKQDMSSSRIARVKMRFVETVMPFIKGYPSGTVDRVVSLSGKKYEDGVVNIRVPGNVEKANDAAFEVFTNEPEPLSLICVYSEEE